MEKDILLNKDPFIPDYKWNLLKERSKRKKEYERMPDSLIKQLTLDFEEEFNKLEDKLL